MGSLRFRRTARIGPGVRLNVNKRSVGLSAGVPGARISMNSDGRSTRSVGVPGTGLYWRDQTGPRAGSSARGSAARPRTPPEVIIARVMFGWFALLVLVILLVVGGIVGELAGNAWIGLAFGFCVWGTLLTSLWQRRQRGPRERTARASSREGTARASSAVASSSSRRIGGGGFRYRLHSRYGADLGEVTVAMMVKPGERISLGGGKAFRVLAVVPYDEEDSALAGILKVEAA